MFLIWSVGHDRLLESVSAYTAERVKWKQINISAFEAKLILFYWRTFRDLAHFSSFSGVQFRVVYRISKDRSKRPNQQFNFSRMHSFKLLFWFLRKTFKGGFRKWALSHLKNPISRSQCLLTEVSCHLNEPRSLDCHHPSLND